MIAVVTDSSAQLPDELVDRYDVRVVPVTVTVDGVDHAEGVDLDADSFYARFAEGTPEVSTSQPSPGAFTRVYDQLAAEGAREILSIHVGSALSGTVNSARLAAAQTDATVHIVDTQTASFGVSCCVWEAAEALRCGASGPDAAVRALATASQVGTVFIVQALDIARAGGRYPVQLPASGIPVLAMEGGGVVEVVTSGTTVEELSAAMVDRMYADGRPIRVALGIADASARPFWEAMEEPLDARDDVVEVVRYRVGPSIGVHTGPGTAGGFWYPV